jgi:hypothetical protein
MPSCLVLFGQTFTEGLSLQRGIRPAEAWFQRVQCTKDQRRRIGMFTLIITRFLPTAKAGGFLARFC